MCRECDFKRRKIGPLPLRHFALLHQGDHLDKHLLADWFQVDVRTIERDLAERLDGIVERYAQGRARRDPGSAPERICAPERHTAGLRAAGDALGQCIADLDRLFELRQCGALTRHESEALKHHLMQRAVSTT